MHLRPSRWLLAPLLLAGCADALGPARRPAPDGPRPDMSYLLNYGYRVEAQVAIPLPEVSYSGVYDGSIPWRGTGVVLQEGDEAVLEVKGTVEVRLHPELVATACTQRVAPLERPSECHYGADGLLQTVGPDYYKEGWAAPLFRVGGSQLPLNFPFRGPGEIEMMRQGTWPAYYNRDLLAPYHRYTGSQTVNIYVRRKQQPELTLSCTPNPVTRGEVVECTAGTNPPVAPGELKITGWTFERRPRSDGDATSVTWKGVMVKGGRVVVRGTIRGGAETRDDEAVRVQRRGWPVMRFPAPRHVVGLESASMADYPPAGLAYGRFLPIWPEFTALPAREIDTGPNAGLWFLPDSVRLPQPLAFVHPALYLPGLPAPLGPGSPGHSQWLLWYNDQNGRPSGTCRGPAIAQFRSNVEIHEGATGSPNSHWEVGNQSLSSSKLHEHFESLTSDQSADDLRFRANDTWQRWLAGPYRNRQRQFDRTDYPNVFNLGCSLDTNPNDS